MLKFWTFGKSGLVTEMKLKAIKAVGNDFLLKKPIAKGLFHFPPI